MTKDVEVTWTYLNIDDAVLQKTKAVAKKNDEQNMGEKRGKLLYDQSSVRFDVDEAYIDREDGELNLNGSIVMSDTGEELMYLGLNIQLKQEAVIDVLKQAVSLYNKVKTVMEASK